MASQTVSERPAKVMTATKLLYLVVLIGIARATMTVIRHADVRSPDFLVYTKLLIYAASVALIYQVSKGKNWARWTLLVILTGSIPLVVLPAYDSIFHNPAQALLVLLQLALYIVGMVFLFQKHSSAWFGSR
jgi:hypothetical protein